MRLIASDSIVIVVQKMAPLRTVLLKAPHPQYSIRYTHLLLIMSSSSSDNTKLATTAILAGSLGAAVSYYLLQKKLKSSTTNNNNYSSSTDIRHPLNSKTSFIFQDPEYDIGYDINSSIKSDNNDTTVLMPHSHEERMRRRIAARMAVEDENSQPRQSVTVRVPASSANCGPGYDCIGLAVDLWTEVTVSRSDKLEITAEGDGAAEMPKDESNLLVTGVKAAYETAKKPMPPLKYHVVSRIPYARGLGSSSAAIVAGIIAGLVLAGHRLPVWGSESLLQIAATIEGHPDNVAPVSYVVVGCCVGGVDKLFCISIHLLKKNAHILCSLFNLPTWHAPNHMRR